ncbi:hypothetical protein [Streptomyces beijiangensis]|uniref:Antitoxin Phd n=1 Tax=Streptomyces beijiangensis TaxID=163361 RepID=A0A939F3S3_9ACTN|nr:hypothetical protein [Streptomyces beijiangensis]MBO0511567.1 hypothetical protein [Streptomyces beijiangensis]
MPAINIEFTVEELDRIKARAASANKSMRAHAHDVLVDEADRLAFVEGAAAIARRMLTDAMARFPEGQR